MWPLSAVLPLLLLCSGPAPSLAWDSGDLELFDLVEEIQRNFYEFLGVQQDASALDIRKAYRKLSLLLHPDKNKEETAETQFRQLVAIYEVLKDEERRQRYNDILLNGLPDWRQPVFYYRRVRRMSNAELGLLLCIILTVGHYAVVWSIYLEKQLDELLSRKKKEKKKKSGGKTGDESRPGQPEKNERILVKPQWHDLLPCKVGVWLYLSVRSIPHLFQEARQLYVDYHQQRIQEKEDALAQAQLETLQKEKKPKVKKPKSEFPVYTVANSSAYVPTYDQGVSIEEIEEQVDDWLENRAQKKKVPGWTEEDMCQLTKHMVKFPGGTPGRWEKIAHELGRSVVDVTTKAKQMKDSVTCSSGTVRVSELKSTAQNLKGTKMNISMPDSIITQRDEEEDLEEVDRLPDRSELSTTEPRPRRRKPVKSPDSALAVKEDAEDKIRGKRQKDFDSPGQADEDESDDENRKKEGGHVSEELWTQNQQKLLELALQQYPKGTGERWDKIAKCVPGKGKEECMIRYKLLVELVQKRKQAKS